MARHASPSAGPSRREAIDDDDEDVIIIDKTAKSGRKAAPGPSIRAVSGSSGVSAALKSFEDSFGISSSSSSSRKKTVIPKKQASTTDDNRSKLSSVSKITAGPSKFQNSFNDDGKATWSKQQQQSRSTRPDEHRIAEKRKRNEEQDDDASHDSDHSDQNDVDLPRTPAKQPKRAQKPPTAISSISETFKAPLPPSATTSKAREAIEDGPASPGRPKFHRLSSLVGSTTPSTEQDANTSAFDRKPTFAELAVSMGVLARQGGADGQSTIRDPERTVEEDIAELLSPRKKRRGWVKAGLAERAANVVKRQQTNQSLWLHEISRLLAASLPANNAAKKEEGEDHDRSERSASPAKGHKKQNSLSSTRPLRSLQQLHTDLNPSLRLRIIESHSPVPAGLAYLQGGAQTEGSGQGGIHSSGFITSGVAEKLLVTTCRILHDSPTGADGTQAEDDVHTEGLVVFSLTTHPKASSNTSLAISRQNAATPAPAAGREGTAAPLPLRAASVAAAPERAGPKSPYLAVAREKTNGMAEITGRNVGGITGNHSASLMAAERAANNPGDGTVQARIPFGPASAMRRAGEGFDESHTLFVPASVADLHAQLKKGAEIWCWEPWSVLSLPEGLQLSPGASGSMLDQSRGSEDTAAQGSKKGLVINKFALLC